MPDTTMDQFSKVQEKIIQDRIQASALYPAIWKKMITEWKASDPQDRVWLTYSANYIFRTNNIRWAIDPLTLDWRLKTSPRADFARDLCTLSFVLLTHAHHDHLDLDLLSALKSFPIKWIIPDFLLSDVIAQVGLPRENIIVPMPLNPFDVGEIHILPFNGLHWEHTKEGRLKGVPALGYLIECNGRRWLFPGDTRSYNTTGLPAFSNVDIVFAHLWLGRGSALQDQPPLLEAFCRFYLETGTRQVILTHLHELGRDASDYWEQAHVDLVRAKFQEISANLPVSRLMMGESALL